MTVQLRTVQERLLAVITLDVGFPVVESLNVLAEERPTAADALAANRAQLLLVRSPVDDVAAPVRELAPAVGALVRIRPPVGGAEVGQQ